MKMPRRRKKEVAVPIVSMGDIAFLLTIFFILCSNFIKESGIKYTSPRSADVKGVKEGRVSVIVDDKGDVFLQGRRIDIVELEPGITLLLTGKTGPDARLVVLRCDKDVDKTFFEPVIDAIAKAGGTIVAVGDKGMQAPHVPSPAAP